MKKIVILRGSFIDSLEEFVLTECLGIMFPECDIEIRSVPMTNCPNDENLIRPDQLHFAL